MDIKIRIVLPEEIAYIWSYYVPYLQKFLNESQGESSMESLLNNIMAGDFQCWEITQDNKIIGVCVTKIDVWVGYKALHILGLGTDAHTWDLFKHTHGVIQQFAEDNGCDRMSSWARKGWIRMFKSSGFSGNNGETYEHMYDILHMKIKNSRDLSNHDL